jgi:hypothetical protein
MDQRTIHEHTYLHSIGFFHGETCIYSFWCSNPPNYKEKESVLIKVNGKNTSVTIRQIEHSIEYDLKTTEISFLRLDISVEIF